MRLRPRFRLMLYATFGTLLVTGGAWLAGDQLKDAESGELWQEAAADLLMLHGGAAMLALTLLGALVPLHVTPGWRKRRNLATGIAMVTVNAILVATAFGLYYAGSEQLRPWISDVHIVVGLCLPILLLVHIRVGKRDSQGVPATLQSSSNSPI